MKTKTQKTVISAAEAVALIEAAAKAATEGIRVCTSCKIGEVPAHQGDVYIHRVPDNVERGALWGSQQVAVGTTTGSRHVAEGEGVEVYHSKGLPKAVKPAPDVPASAYQGPIVVAPNGFTLTHPEHAHHVLPAGTYQVTYQVDVVRQARVQD